MDNIYNVIKNHLEKFGYKRVLVKLDDNIVEYYDKKFKNYKLRYAINVTNNSHDISKYQFTIYHEDSQVFRSKIINTNTYNQNEFIDDFNNIRLFFNDFIKYW